MNARGFTTRSGAGAHRRLVCRGGRGGRGGCGGSGGRGGFTLLESLVATTLIGVIVIAVISAVMTAQKLSFEGQKLILASMAADDLMLELVTLPYNELQGKDGLIQAPGSIMALDGGVYPSTYWAIGRAVTVKNKTITDPILGVMISGLEVIVVAQDEFRPLATLQTFVPEPAS